MIRLDNMPWEINDAFSFIREDAECQRFTEECETDDYVRDTFKNQYPSFYNKLKYDDLYIERYEHELCEDEAYPTYAVYIYFCEGAVEVLKEMFPHIFL